MSDTIFDDALEHINKVELGDNYQRHSRKYAEMGLDLKNQSQFIRGQVDTRSYVPQQ